MQPLPLVTLVTRCFGICGVQRVRGARKLILKTARDAVGRRGVDEGRSRDPLRVVEHHVLGDQRSALFGSRQKWLFRTASMLRRLWTATLLRVILWH